MYVNVHNFVWLPWQPFKSRTLISWGLFVTTTRRNTELLVHNHMHTRKSQHSQTISRIVCWEIHVKRGYSNHKTLQNATIVRMQVPMETRYSNEIASVRRETNCCVWPVAWWRHQMETFSALLALCAGNSPVPVNSPHKGQWRGALMFSVIYAWINDWVNDREAGDLRRQRGHYDVIVMRAFKLKLGQNLFNVKMCYNRFYARFVQDSTYCNKTT